MRAVNLLPAARAEKPRENGDSRARTTKAIAIAGGAVLALVAVVVGFAFVQGRSTVSDRQAKLDDVQSQVSRTQAAAALPSAARATSQAHLAAITSAASGRIAWDGLLAELSRVMPSGSWLETLQAGNGAAASSSTTSSSTSTPSTSTTTSSTPATAVAGATSTSGAAPTSFTVTGYALSQDIVALALDRLALIPALSDVSLQSTQRAPVGTTNAVQFTIGANVRSAGGNG
jgi:Tfp pilus assembly protein PilN